MFKTLYCEGNVYTQRTICSCLISFAGFLRSCETMVIKCWDIVIESTHNIMSIFIEQSKTDTYRDGAGF